MSKKRVHSAKATKEVVTRQKKYDRKIENNKIKEPEADSKRVPTREDAEKIVQQRKMERSKTNVVKVVPKRKKRLQVSVNHPIFAISILLLLAVSLLLLFIKNDKPSLVSSSQQEVKEYTVTITLGMSASQIAALLESEGVIKNSKAFERYLEITGDSTKLQAGTFSFSEGMSEAEISQLLVSKKQTQTEREITIFAGQTIKDVDKKLVDLKLAEEGAFIRAVEQIKNDRNLPFSEGWFLSGNYTVTRGEKSIYKLALEMQDALNIAARPYLTQLEELDISLADALIIASLIQGETNEAAQMVQIARVIYNRLEAEMTIGIDASYNYALKNWDGDLSQASLYNTRINRALPPTGIGMPSLAAIDGALRPSNHKWYYYIHDKKGAIHFGATLEEHNANIQRYLSE